MKLFFTLTALLVLPSVARAQIGQPHYIYDYAPTSSLNQNLARILMQQGSAKAPYTYTTPYQILNSGFPASFGTLAVSGAASFSGALSVAGGAAFNGTINLGYLAGSVQCLQVDASGNVGVSGIGACGSGGGGGGGVFAVQDFLSGSGFTPGTTTSLTLTSAPASADALSVYFDGVRQSGNTWTLTGPTITFTAPIPSGTQVVEAQWGTAPGVGVTNVGLSMPAPFAVSGSPVTSVGTFSVTLTSEPAGEVWAAPALGSGAPTFRALVGSDLPLFSTSANGAVPASPGGTGTYLRADGTWASTVTSVGISMPSDFAVASSPITGAGVLAVTRNSELANEVLASPNGSAGVPGYRALVAADLPGAGVTAINGTNCTIGGTCTITAAATSIAGGTTTITGGSSGQFLYDNAGTAGFKALSTNDLPASGVTAGSYTAANITVNSQGQITAAANGGNSPPSAGMVYSTGTALGAAALGTGLSYSGGTLSLSGITDAALAPMTAWTIKGNCTSGSGSPQSCHQPTINAEDFGVTGNGSTDDSSAMNAAVAACETLGGCTIHIGTTTGTTFLMHGVQVASGSVQISCDRGVLIANNSTNTYAIEFGNGATRYYGDTIQGCGFGQASGVTPTTGNVALEVNEIGSMNIRDVGIGQYPAAPQIGLILNNASRATIDNLAVSNQLADGVQITGNSTDVYITNSTSDANGAVGWHVMYAQGLYLTNITAYDNSTYAWEFDSSGGGHNYNIFVENSVGDTSGSYNWVVSDCGNCVFSNVWGSTQKSTSSNTFATGFYINSSSSHDIEFVNAVAVNNNSHGMSINYNSGMPSNISIVNPTFGGVGGGNGKSGSGYGLYVYPAASAVTVTGGEMLNNPSGAASISGASVLMQGVQGYSPMLVKSEITTPIIGGTSNWTSNITSIPLSAGTWEIWASGGVALSSATSAYVQVQPSTTSGSYSGGQFGCTGQFDGQLASGDTRINSGHCYMTFSGGTTVYLVETCTATSGSCTGYGGIYAKQVGW